jgi:NHL repeat
MKYFLKALCVVALMVGAALPPGADAQTVLPIGDGSFSTPGGIALDNAGNLFVADSGNNAVKELTAASGYATVKRLAPTTGNFTLPMAVAIDGNDNVFVADLGNMSVKEILAPDYTTVMTLGGSDFTGLLESVGPMGIALDAGGNVFISGLFANRSGTTARLAEIPAAGGYSSLMLLPAGSGMLLFSPAGLAVDHQGNLLATLPSTSQIAQITAASGFGSVNFLADSTGHFTGSEGVAVDVSGNVFVAGIGLPPALQPLQEILAAGGFVTVDPVAAATGNFGSLTGVAVAPTGNIFVAGQDAGGTNIVEEVLAAPQPLAASILPGSRSVATHEPATVFATVINAGSTTAENCQVQLPVTDISGINLTYQTTNPATNALTGAPNTPVAIAPGKFQTFLLSFSSEVALMAPGLTPTFQCDVGTPAAAGLVPGVDTVDLFFNDNPTADIIALAQVASADDILHIATGSSGAFAVATANAGTASTITASTDTGSATLPVTVTICQSNPMNGQCLAAPAPTATLDVSSGATPTFSIFAAVGGAIPVNPAAARIFVKFTDSSGNLVGSTSVAVSSP